MASIVIMADCSLFKDVSPHLMPTSMISGLFYSSMTSFANQIAPQGSATTTTALAFTVTDGIGAFYFSKQCCRLRETRRCQEERQQRFCVGRALFVFDFVTDA